MTSTLATLTSQLATLEGKLNEADTRQAGVDGLSQRVSQLERLMRQLAPK